MILIFVILFLAMIVEIQILPISVFVIMAMAFYFRYFLAKVVVPIAVVGVLLDALVPRYLGATPICLLIFITIIELVVMQKGAKREQFAWIGVIFVLLEGIVEARTIVSIVVGVILYLGVVLLLQVTHRHESGFIVRREI